MVSMPHYLKFQYNIYQKKHTHTHTHTNDRETGIDPQNWFSEVYLKVPTLESPDVARSALIQYEAHLLSVHPILRAELVAALKATIRVSSEVTQKGKNSGIKGCPTHRLYRAFHVDNEPLSFFSIDYIRDVMRRHPSTELLSTLTHTHTHTHTHNLQLPQPITTSDRFSAIKLIQAESSNLKLEGHPLQQVKKPTELPLPPLPPTAERKTLGLVGNLSLDAIENGNALSELYRLGSESAHNRDRMWRENYDKNKYKLYRER
eukprot:GHVR01061653.1.p1 GENE.GHVR01061653.1~~GHVR01061653.1.p1  ORF type:complete len:261 (+),score=90.74 GHVR01061653.1:251-1033(+)